MLLMCTTPDYKSSQIFQDDQVGHAHFYAPKYGFFLSSFQILYEPGNMMTGIRFFAEAMPIISNIQIEYNVSAGFENYPVTIDNQRVENCGLQSAQKKVAFTKIYETTGQWNSNNPEVKGYLMSPNISMPPPNFMNADAAGINSIYKSTTSQFGFENPVKTVLSSTQEVLVFVTAKYEARISSTVQEQKGSVPYTAKLTLANRVTGDKIMDYAATGTWQGVTTSGVDTKITETLAKCENETPNDGNKNERNNNLRN